MPIMVIGYICYDMYKSSHKKAKTDNKNVKSCNNYDDEIDKILEWIEIDKCERDYENKYIENGKAILKNTSFLKLNTEIVLVTN
jgi:hypothetical protein